MQKNNNEIAVSGCTRLFTDSGASETRDPHTEATGVNIINNIEIVCGTSSLGHQNAK